MNVILYSTNCPKCSVLKKKLADSGVEYTENNNVNDMLELGIVQVPVLSVNGNLFDFGQAVKWLADL